MIKTLLFDLSEVILTGLKGTEDVIAEYVHDDPGTVASHLMGPHLTRYLEGKTTEREYWREFTRRSGYDVPVIFLEGAVRDNFRPIPGTLDIVDDLARQGYLLGLVSDHSAEWVDYLQQHFPESFTAFNTLHFSYSVGSTKKSKKIFRHALAALRANPADTFFVDDDANNLRVAYDARIEHVYQFKDAKALELVLLGQGIIIDGRP
ncbi:MAG: HAD family hydrolase [Nanoarchaeota archaeon]